jgi:D-sedoheptulose 7-phosphate isomerase
MGSEAEAAEQFLAEVVRTIDKIDRNELFGVINRLLRAWRDGRAVYVMGNGGSASTASHFAADLAKYTAVEGRRRFRVLALTDNVPLVSALTNDDGFGSIFVAQLEAWIEEGDVLVGFSVHGGSGSANAGPWSQNLIRAIAKARTVGAGVIGFSGHDGGAMAELADHCVTVPVATAELGTPLVEGLHVVLHHLVVHRLRCLVAAG